MPEVQWWLDFETVLKPPYITPKYEVFAYPEPGCTCMAYLDRLLRLRGLQRRSFLGNGCYARVWATSNPRLVVKLDSDHRGSGLAYKTMKAQEHGKAMGFVRVFYVHAVEGCQEHGAHYPKWVHILERLHENTIEQARVVAGIRQTRRPDFVTPYRRPLTDDADYDCDDTHGAATFYNHREIHKAMLATDVGSMDDLHAGNVMWRMTPKPQLVVSDLGMSHPAKGKTFGKPPKMPVLRSALAKLLLVPSVQP